LTSLIGSSFGKWLLKDYISQKRKGGEKAFCAIFSVSAAITDKEVDLAIVQSQFLFNFPSNYCPGHHTRLFFIELQSHPSVARAVLKS